MTSQKRIINTSERTEGLIDASASYYQESKLFHAIQNSQALEYDRIDDNNLDLALQLSPLTATWGLVYWEVANGIKPSPNGDYEQRRPMVLSKMVSDSNFSVKLVTGKLQPYDPSVFVSIDVAECLVSVIFKQLPNPSDLYNCKQILNDIIHAHLGYLFIAMIASRFPNPNKLDFTAINVHLYNRYYSSDIQLDGKRKLDGTWKLNSETPHRADLHSLAIKSSLPNLYGAIQSIAVEVSGEPLPYNQDVEISSKTSIVNQNLCDANRVHTTTAVINENTLSGTLITDTVWKLDGSIRLDGSRKLNAGIKTESI